jgi:DNA-binding LacI/PurR family transcriptional regulator
MVEGVSRRLAKEFRDKIKTGQWPQGKRVPTTRELAAHYQVSVNTVQNAFRELEAFDLVERRPRLGGFVKTQPGAITSKATTIAVVGSYTSAGMSTSEADESWGYRIIRGCDAEMAEAKFHLSMFSHPPRDPDALPKILAMVDQAGDKLGGVLLFVYARPEAAALRNELDRRNIPWVTVNRPREHAAQNFVTSEMVLGSRVVARCFAKMGVERAVFLCNCLSVGNSTNDKYLGFMEGWLESGKSSRNADFLSCGEITEPVGYACMKKYLAENDPPQAVFAAGDLLAIGAARALRERGVVVGKDTLLVGSTGLQVATYATPPLTVIESPMEQMGREAVRMLLEMHREGVRRMMGRYVPAKLVIRESCPIPADMLARELKLIEQEV